MTRTFEAIIDEKGKIRLLDPVKLPASSRVLITIIDDTVPVQVNEEALLSESALSKDWDRPEEDEAWNYLQEDQSY